LEKIRKKGINISFCVSPLLTRRCQAQEHHTLLPWRTGKASFSVRLLLGLIYLYAEITLFVV
jgi:hypothetical protein